MNRETFNLLLDFWMSCSPAERSAVRARVWLARARRARRYRQPHPESSPSLGEALGKPGCGVGESEALERRKRERA